MEEKGGEIRFWLVWDLSILQIFEQILIALELRNRSYINSEEQILVLADFKLKRISFWLGSILVLSG